MVIHPRRVLVVAAHPDDEVLGCGGTIARHAHEGDQVQILIVAEGSTSRQRKRNRTLVQDELSDLAKSAQLVSSILGAEGVELLDLPDNRLDSLDRLDLIKLIEEHISHFQPECVYVHHSGDVNVDHCRLHESVVTARPTPDHLLSSYLVLKCKQPEWQPPGSSLPQPNYLLIFQIIGSTKAACRLFQRNGMAPCCRCKQLNI